jgi:hypothetical protein
MSSPRPQVTLQVLPFSETSLILVATSCPTSNRLGWRSLASLNGRKAVMEGRPIERMYPWSSTELTSAVRVCTQYLLVMQSQKQGLGLTNPVLRSPLTIPSLTFSGSRLNSILLLALTFSSPSLPPSLALESDE